MKKRKDDIPGQISFCFDDEQYIVQANEIINGRQALSLCAAKIIRACIMQIKPRDTVLNPYIIPIGNLAKMINVNRVTLSHEIDRITDEILTRPITIKEYIPEENVYRFAKIPWVETIAYSSRSGLYIKLNDALKPYVLQLSTRYTQYLFQDVVQMKSVYGVRIYEIIMSNIHERILPPEGLDIDIGLDDLRIATDTQDKFERYSNFKEKVIQRAESEILRATTYKVTHTEIKTGKKITGIRFHVTMQYY